MNTQKIYLLLVIQICLTPLIFAQKKNQSNDTLKVSKLFKKQSELPIKLKYSISDLKKNKNDSIFIKTTLSYKNKKQEWHNIPIEIRARGNFRREKCYFSPVKIKIKKASAKGTLFKGNKRLKLVLPCSLTKDKNDNVLKEYMAYKFYEIISKYNFKTRLVEIALTEIKGKKTKEHKIKGILIEDDKKVANRHHGKIVKRAINPMAQDALSSTRNAFFQFMIGNVDFSIAKQHNAKLLYINKKIISVPYDFDMCGLVNPSYAVPSLNMTHITQRKYRGVKRDIGVMTQVRNEFIKNKKSIENIVNSLETKFENKSEFNEAKDYINSFYQILLNDKRFKNEIIEQMRY